MDFLHHYSHNDTMLVLVACKPTCSMPDGDVVVKVLPRLRTPCNDKCKGLQRYHTVTIIPQ